MPLKGFVSPGPGVSLFYAVYPALNSPFPVEAGDTSESDSHGLDYSKPTILLLHAWHWDGTCFFRQLQDSRIRLRFNAVALDFRSCGQSKISIDSRYNPAVAAADIVISLSRFPIPLPQKLHILTVDSFSSGVAERIGAFWPDILGSMTLHGLSETDAATGPSPERSAGYEEMAEYWIHPTEKGQYLESIAHAIELQHGQDLSDEVLDITGNQYLTRYPPRHALLAWVSWNPFENRTPLSPELWNGITCPVLIIHGLQDVTYPPYYAEDTRNRLASTQAEIVLIPDGAHCCYLVPYQAFNGAFLNFMNTHFPPNPEATPVWTLDAHSRFSPDIKKGFERAQKTGAKPLPLGAELASIHFSTVSDERDAQVQLVLVKLREWEERNKSMFPDWPSWWDRPEGERVEVSLPFRFSRRQTYLQEHHPDA